MSKRGKRSRKDRPRSRSKRGKQMAEERFTDERYCEECGQDTPHDIISGTHERDASNDSATCCVCGTMKDGWGQTMQHTRPSYRKANGILDPNADPDT